MSGGNAIAFKMHVDSAIEENGLSASLFFKKVTTPRGLTKVFPRGAILEKSGRKISRIVLKVDNEEVASCRPRLPSPNMEKNFPDHPFSGHSGFRMNFGMTLGAGPYSLVAEVEGSGEFPIARPVIVSWKGNLDVAKEKRAHPDIIEPEFWDILENIWLRSTLRVPVLYNLYSAMKYIIEAKIPGDFMECGVFMGGNVMMMAEMCKRHDDAASRRVFALDTFSGFVKVDAELDVDIRTGKKLTTTSFKDFFDKSTANMQSVGFDRLNIVRGDVMETIPTVDTQKIALLRLDTDTYETTKFELEQLYDRIPAGGVIIIDDYGYTHGCRKAVEDFSVGRYIFPQRINAYCRTFIKVQG